MGSLYSCIVALQLEGVRLKGGAYQITEVQPQRIKLERTSTRSKVNVSTRMISASLSRLNEGEFIKKRTISYTVTQEVCVVYVLERLGALIHTKEEGVSGYRIAKSFDGLNVLQ